MKKEVAMKQKFYFRNHAGDTESLEAQDLKDLALLLRQKGYRRLVTVTNKKGQGMGVLCVTWTQAPDALETGHATHNIHAGDYIKF